MPIANPLIKTNQVMPIGDWLGDGGGGGGTCASAGSTMANTATKTNSVTRYKDFFIFGSLLFDEYHFIIQNH